VPFLLCETVLKENELPLRQEMGRENMSFMFIIQGLFRRAMQVGLRLASETMAPHCAVPTLVPPTQFQAGCGSCFSEMDTGPCTLSLLLIKLIAA
jgi:hypothetical protein